MDKNLIRDWASEADVAAEFYHQIRLRETFTVYLEVPLPSQHHRSRSFRADAVVCKDDKAVCAIEFKRDHKEATIRGRQASAYEDLGMPYMVCNGRKAIPGVVEELHKRFSEALQ